MVESESIVNVHIEIIESAMEETQGNESVYVAMINFHGVIWVVGNSRA